MKAKKFSDLKPFTTLDAIHRAEQSLKRAADDLHLVAFGLKMSPGAGERIP